MTALTLGALFAYAAFWPPSPAPVAGKPALAAPHEAAPDGLFSHRRALPRGNVLLAYATTCNFERVVQHVRDGVNVVAWFSGSLVSSSALPAVSFSLHDRFACISKVVNYLEEAELPTTHLLCIGGWNAPHPDPAFDGASYFVAFDTWNRENAANFGFRGFDGVDWDLEGNDDPGSAYNTFTPRTLAIVADFSTRAKGAGYLVSLVPPESYFEPIRSSRFDRRVNMTPSVPWHQDFSYAGRNVYAYWLAKCGKDMFDLINIQLYESWSYAGYATELAGKAVEDFLVDFVVQYWNSNLYVRFSLDSDAGLPDMAVGPLDVSSQITVGFSFGGGDGKSFFAHPWQVGRAWARLRSMRDDGKRDSTGRFIVGPPRGVFYWNLNLDPSDSANATIDNYIYMAKEFNDFLETRVDTSKTDAGILV